MAEIVVHHLDSSRSQRVLWLLEELGLDYGIETYRRDPATLRAPESLREIHPLGRSPVVTLDGVAHAESGAVVETLLDTFGSAMLRPEAGTEAFRWYRYWLHYAEGSLMPPLLVRLIVSRMRTAPVPFFLRPVVRSVAGRIDAAYSGPELERHLAFVESHLQDHRWFAGDDFTAADIMMSYPLQAAMARAAPGESHPCTTGWLTRIGERPAYEAALHRGGPNPVL